MLNRRQFLKLVPGFVFLPPAYMVTKTRKRVFILEQYVVGFQFYHGPTMIDSLQPGDSLCLQREPENSYDEMAVAIYSRNDLKLGYVPRYHNVVPAGMLDQGLSLETEITKINPVLSPPGKRIKFAVYHPVG